MLGGLVLIAVGAYTNASKAVEAEGTWYSPICIAIVALAFASALAWVVMQHQWQNRRYGLAAVALLGLVCSELYGLQLSAERLLAAREQRARQVSLEGGPYAAMQKALDDTVSERKEECRVWGPKCSRLRELEASQRAQLGKLQPPGSKALIADTTGLPPWLVEILPALLFSVGLQVLGFVLVGFGAHGSLEHEVNVAAAQATEPDETERVVNWVRAYRQRHGRDPKIPEVQAEFDLSRTTAWRRIKNA